MTIPARRKRAAPPKRAVRAADTTVIDDAIAERKLILTPIESPC